MQVIDSEHTDWRGKFLFVGNQLALDLLNTSLIQNDQRVELLTTPADLADWLAAAGLIGPAEATVLAQTWLTDQAATELTEIRTFREHLRSAVIDTEAGRLPAPTFIANLNRWLAGYPTLRQAEVRDHTLASTVRFAPHTPREAMQPLAAAALDVLTHADHTRLRQCGGCVVHFLDVSKKGSRCWCSMNLCGNRRKVAAYQSRRRTQANS